MIGYYVHHHGEGHRARALAIAAPAPDRFMLLGTGLTGRTGAVPAIDLPDDRLGDAGGFTGEDRNQDRPAALHYAPLHHDGVRDRVARITEWIARGRPELMVVDVSVEMAMLARLAATPTVVVRLTGDRTDAAHLDAFRGACGILAPFHEDLEHPATPQWVRARTLYAPALSAMPRPGGQTPDPSRVLVLFGAGGGEADGDALAEAARHTPGLTWRVLGPMSPAGDPPDNLQALGWRDDVDAEIARAGVVVGSGGNGVVGAVLALGRPLVCLPQHRPFDEQLATARGLAAADAALCLERWPPAEAWPGLLAEARAMAPTARRRLIQGRGAEDVRRWLYHLADHAPSSAGAL